jgi:hypothetical protein
VTTRKTPAEPGDGLATARAVARQVDALKPRVSVLESKVDGLQRGMTVLLQRSEPEEPEAEEQAAGQPDWIGCRDPDAARAMLTDTYRWLEDAGAHLGIVVTDCWPWHPKAIVLLLAAFTHYTAVYAGESSTAVTEFLTRYQEALEKRIRSAIGDECNAESHKHAGGARYDYDLDRLEDVAIWWATDRTNLPPGLTPRMAVAR